jgi:hypothetical protein
LGMLILTGFNLRQMAAAVAGMGSLLGTWLLMTAHHQARAALTLGCLNRRLMLARAQARLRALP